MLKKITIERFGDLPQWVVRTVRQKHPERNQFWAISTAPDADYECDLSNFLSQRWWKITFRLPLVVFLLTFFLLRRLSASQTHATSSFRSSVIREKHFETLKIRRKATKKLGRDTKNLSIRTKWNHQSKTTTKMVECETERDGSITADVKIGQLQCSSFIALHHKWRLLFGLGTRPKPQPPSGRADSAIFCDEIPLSDDDKWSNL